MSTVQTGGGCKVGSLSILQLQKFKELFRDDAAYADFVVAIRRVTDPGVFSVMLDDDSPICGIVSTDDAQVAMRSRIVLRLMSDPKALDEIRQRIEDDRMVQYGKLDDD